jgi:hypothetical protein
MAEVYRLGSGIDSLPIKIYDYAYPIVAAD